MPIYDMNYPTANRNLMPRERFDEFKHVFASSFYIHLVNPDFSSEHRGEFIIQVPRRSIPRYAKFTRDGEVFKVRPISSNMAIEYWDGVENADIAPHFGSAYCIWLPKSARQESKGIDIDIRRNVQILEKTYGFHFSPGSKFQKLLHSPTPIFYSVTIGKADLDREELVLLSKEEERRMIKKAKRAKKLKLQTLNQRSVSETHTPEYLAASYEEESPIALMESGSGLENAIQEPIERRKYTEQEMQEIEARLRQGNHIK